jgi:hypothetical protein
MLTLTAWILSLIYKLEPKPACGENCISIARSMSDWSIKNPLFVTRGSVDGKAETGSLLVALSWHESRFVEDVKGDHKTSFGLYQINFDTAKLVETKAKREDLIEVDSATPIALRLIKESMKICKDEPLQYQLAWYAWGRDGCHREGFVKSMHRIQLAQRLYKENPPFYAAEPLQKAE